MLGGLGSVLSSIGSLTSIFGAAWQAEPTSLFDSGPSSSRQRPPSGPPNMLAVVGSAAFDALEQERRRAEEGARRMRAYTSELEKEALWAREQLKRKVQSANGASEAAECPANAPRDLCVPIICAVVLLPTTPLGAGARAQVCAPSWPCVPSP